MALQNLRAIRKGNQFASMDPRHKGRAVRVVQALGLNQSAGAHLQKSVRMPHAARLTQRRTYFIVEVIANPGNPKTVGDQGRISEKTLRERYERMSR